MAIDACLVEVLAGSSTCVESQGHNAKTDQTSPVLILFLAFNSSKKKYCPRILKLLESSFCLSWNEEITDEAMAVSQLNRLLVTACAVTVFFHLSALFEASAGPSDTGDPNHKVNISNTNINIKGRSTTTTNTGKSYSLGGILRGGGKARAGLGKGDILLIKDKKSMDAVQSILDATTHNQMYWSIKLNKNTFRDECFCMNPKATFECCQRQLLLPHKFGYIVLSSMFKKQNQAGVFHKWSYERIDDLDQVLPPFSSVSDNPEDPLQDEIDYRHVIPIRNWYDAIISGYLYHREGKECWVNSFGQPMRPNKPMMRDVPWDIQLTHDSPDFPYPARNGRSICELLRDENEEVGMRVYADWALSYLYNQLVPYWEEIVKREHETGVHKTIFACFELLSDYDLKQDIWQLLTGFFYPGGHNLKFPYEQVYKASKDNHAAHSSSHDPELRARLRSILDDLDARLFNYKIRESQDIFGCGEGNYASQKKN